jgi:hypothetical protein
VSLGEHLVLDESERDHHTAGGIGPTIDAHEIMGAVSGCELGQGRIRLRIAEAISNRLRREPDRRRVEKQ